MWKIFVLVLTLLAVNHCDDVIQKMIEHVNRNIKACSGLKAKLNQSMDTFLKYNKKHRNSMTMCEQIHTYLLTSLEPTIQQWDRCIPNSYDEDTFAVAIKSLISGIQHLCNMRGESIFELTNPCLRLDTEKKEIVTCDNQTEMKLRIFNGRATAETFCDLLSTVELCTQKRAISFCKNPKTKQDAMSAFDALLTPCNAASSIRNLFFNVLSRAENNN